MGVLWTIYNSYTSSNQAYPIFSHTSFLPRYFSHMFFSTVTSTPFCMRVPSIPTAVTVQPSSPKVQRLWLMPYSKQRPSQLLFVDKQICPQPGTVNRQVPVSWAAPKASWPPALGAPAHSLTAPTAGLSSVGCLTWKSSIEPHCPCNKETALPLLFRWHNVYLRALEAPKGTQRERHS